jgi:hypothetical protein
VEYVILGIFALAIYFIPTCIAVLREKRNAGAIFALNLLAGWTFIGWLVAIVWALTQDAPRTIVVTRQ